MQLLLNSARIGELEALADTGLISGVTTNPSILSGCQAPLLPLLMALANLTPGYLHIQSTAGSWQAHVDEARKLVKLGPKIAVKLPFTHEGVRACKELANKGVPVNMTLCMSVPQALIAAKAGASYISIFSGRLSENGFDGRGVLRASRKALEEAGSTAKVLAASITTCQALEDALKAGAHLATTSFEIILSLYDFHP